MSKMPVLNVVIIILSSEEGRSVEVGSSGGWFEEEEATKGKRLGEVAVGFRDGVGGDRRTGWEREDLVR
jgi:hypothetical protein